MSKQPPNIVKRTFDEYWNQRGFRRAGGAWYRRSGDVDEYVGLQKSQYSLAYYMNLSFGLRDLEAPSKPHPERAHISLRVDNLPSPAPIEAVLNLESAMSDEVRREALLRFLSEHVEPFLDRAGSTGGLQAMLRDGTLDGALVRLAAREHLQSA